MAQSFTEGHRNIIFLYPSMSSVFSVYKVISAAGWMDEAGGQVGAVFGAAALGWSPAGWPGRGAFAGTSHPTAS